MKTRLRANGRNNSQQCLELLANNVASICTGLKVWPVSNFAQQHATTFNNMQQGVQTDAICNIQQCWELLVYNVASVCTQPKTMSQRCTKSLKFSIWYKLNRRNSRKGLEYWKRSSLVKAVIKVDIIMKFHTFQRRRKDLKHHLRAYYELTKWPATNWLDG